VSQAISFLHNRAGPIVIKYVARGALKRGADRWLRQLPQHRPELNGCKFLFDPDARGYDWLVVYDDLPPVGGERFSSRIEELDCPAENTMLITSEPSSVNIYGQAFLRQFGHVLSSQEPWAIRHPSHIHSQAGLKWFYGMGQVVLRHGPHLQQTLRRDAGEAAARKNQGHFDGLLGQAPAPHAAQQALRFHRRAQSAHPRARDIRAWRARYG
jgi:hypothetical protein